MAAQQLQLKVGDEVDMYQNQSNKDTSGWFGPCTVETLSRLDHGMITVKYNNRLYECEIQKIRRHLFFLCLLAAPAAVPQFQSVWNSLRQAVERLDFSDLDRLCYLQAGNST